MKRKTGLIYIFSFLLPVFVVVVNLFLLNIFPFGEKSFLYWDTNFEYINFFEYFKTLFTTNNNLFYTFSRLGGADILGFSIFYNFFSPFNFLFFIFPDEYINIALEIVMIIKIGLCGLTCSYFLNKEVKESYLSIVLALSYALSMHTIITMMSNYILMDGLILFPLVILGASKIVEKNDYKLYAVTLFLSMITNAYMAYVSILFSFLYFIYKIFLKEKNELKSHLLNIKTLLFSTAITISLCMWFVIPLLFNLSDGKYDFFEAENGLFSIRIGFLEIIFKFFTAIIHNLFFLDKYPYLFLGIIVTVFFVLYFFNSAYSKKERIVSLIFTGFLFLCFSLNCLFILFNMGVENPCGTIYRFGFVQIFFIVFLAYKAIINLNLIKPKYIFITGLLYIIAFFAVNQKFHFLKYSYIFIIDAIIVTLTICILYLITKFQKKSLFNILLSIILIINICNIAYNMKFVMSKQKRFLACTNINKFSTFVKAAKDTIGYIKKIDKGFYRIETRSNYYDVDANRLHNNIGMLLNYNTVSHYSSSGNPDLKEFYKNIGYVTVFDKNPGVTYEDSMQLLPYSLMGTKYIISSKNMSKNYELIKSFKYDNKFYPNLNVYKNPYALPMAFVIRNNNDLYFDIPSNNKDTIDYQNNIVKILSNKDYGDIYKRVYENVIRKYGSISENKIRGINCNFYIPPYKLDASENIYLGIYNNTEDKEQLPNDITYNNVVISTFAKLSKYQTMRLDNYNENQYINIGLIILLPELIGKYDPNTYYISLITENTNILKKYFEELSKNPVELERISSSHLKAKLNIDNDNQLLFMTIPYNEGWKIKVNGKKVKQIKVFNAMMAIPVAKSDTELEMEYVPRGFYLGLIISLIGLSLLIFSILIAKKNKNE